MEGAGKGLETVGLMVALMTRSAQHQSVRIRDLEWLIFPPAALGHVHIFRIDGQAAGYATWANLSDEVADQFLRRHPVRLTETEWNSGENRWLIDLVIPPDYLAIAKEELDKLIFRGTSVSTLVMGNEDNPNSLKKVFWQ